MGEYFSGQKANAPALCFRGADDALNFASDCVKDSQRWGTLRCLNLIERYRMGEVAIVLKISTGGEPEQCHAIFSAIPHQAIVDSSIPDFATDDVKSGPNGSRDQKAVFAYRAQSIQGPEFEVPSFVSLVGPEQLSDFVGQVFASPFDEFIQLSSVSLADWKVRTVRLGDTIQFGGGVPSLVEGGSQIFDDVGGDIAHLGGQTSAELDVELFTRYVRIHLSDNLGRICVPERFASSQQVSDVFFCSGKPALRAIEGISHGKIRSNE